MAKVTGHFACFFYLVVYLHLPLNGFIIFLKKYFTQLSSSRLSDNVVCINIPSNITLCQNIGYKKMRLPNLLHHESLQEVSQIVSFFYYASKRFETKKIKAKE
jgi:secreted frizzled-related protein 5